MVRKNVAYLREHGPATRTELPVETIKAADRMDGVWKFSITGGNGAAGPVGGMVTTVYYLRDEHSREAVLRRFRDANPRLVAAKDPDGLRAMLRGHGSEWHAAIGAVFPTTAEVDARRTHPDEEVADGE